MIEIFYSKYIFFVIVSLIVNFFTIILFNSKKKMFKMKEVIIYTVFEYIFVFIFAKLIDIIVRKPAYIYMFQNNMFINMFTNGYGFLGGIFGAVFGLALANKIVKKDINQVFDLYIPNLLLIYSIIKIGCFFAGCCDGILINNKALPIQIIESCIYMLMYLFTINLRKKEKNYLAAECILFGLIRFFVDFFRADYAYSFLVIYQIISIGIFVYGIYLKVSWKKVGVKDEKQTN